MLPAYAAIGVGYWIGRVTRWDWLRLLSGVLMYGLIPLVVLRNALSLYPGGALGNVALSITFSGLMVLCGWLLLPRIATDIPRRLAYCAFGYTNIGWFGIPTGLALFGSGSLPILVMAYVGASLRKMASSPPLYAFGAGLTCRGLGFGDAASLSAETPFCVAALLMSACGMMVVGLGASRVRFSWAGIRTTLRLVACRHAAGIVVISVFVALFAVCGHPIGHGAHDAVILTELLSVAGSIVIFAAQLRSDVAASALIVTVLTALSTVLVLIWGAVLHGS